MCEFLSLWLPNFLYLLQLWPTSSSYHWVASCRQLSHAKCRYFTVLPMLLIEDLLLLRSSMLINPPQLYGQKLSWILIYDVALGCLSHYFCYAAAVFGPDDLIGMLWSVTAISSCSCMQWLNLLGDVVFNHSTFSASRALYQISDDFQLSSELDNISFYDSWSRINAESQWFLLW